MLELSSWPNRIQIWFKIEYDMFEHWKTWTPWGYVSPLFLCNSYTLAFCWEFSGDKQPQTKVLEICLYIYIIYYTNIIYCSSSYPSIFKEFLYIDCTIEECQTEVNMLASLSGNMQQTMVMQMVQQVGRCGMPLSPEYLGICVFFPDS